MKLGVYKSIFQSTIAVIHLQRYFLAGGTLFPLVILTHLLSSLLLFVVPKPSKFKDKTIALPISYNVPTHLLRTVGFYSTFAIWKPTHTVLIGLQPLLSQSTKILLTLLYLLFALTKNSLRHLLNESVAVFLYLIISPQEMAPHIPPIPLMDPETPYPRSLVVAFLLHQYALTSLQGLGLMTLALPFLWYYGASSLAVNNWKDLLCTCLLFVTSAVTFLMDNAHAFVEHYSLVRVVYSMLTLALPIMYFEAPVSDVEMLIVATGWTICLLALLYKKKHSISLVRNKTSEKRAWLDFTVGILLVCVYWASLNEVPQLPQENSHFQFKAFHSIKHTAPFEQKIAMDSIFYRDTPQGRRPTIAVTYTNEAFLEHVTLSLCSVFATDSATKVLVIALDSQLCKRLGNITAEDQKINCATPTTSYLVSSEAQRWTSDMQTAYGKLLQTKLYILEFLTQLEIRPDILLFDSDVVFQEKLFWKTFDSMANIRYDMLFMRDPRPESSNAFTSDNWINFGFFLLRNRDITREFIANILSISLAERVSDQDAAQYLITGSPQVARMENEYPHMRSRMTALSVRMLESDVYPNGPFYKYFKPKNAFVIHTNGNRFEEKLSMMRSIAVHEQCIGFIGDPTRLDTILQEHTIHKLWGVERVVITLFVGNDLELAQLSLGYLVYAGVSPGKILALATKNSFCEEIRRFFPGVCLGLNQLFNGVSAKAQEKLKRLWTTEVVARGVNSLSMTSGAFVVVGESLGEYLTSKITANQSIILSEVSDISTGKLTKRVWPTVIFARNTSKSLALLREKNSKSWKDASFPVHIVSCGGNSVLFHGNSGIVCVSDSAEGMFKSLQNFLYVKNSKLSRVCPSKKRFLSHRKHEIKHFQNAYHKTLCKFLTPGSRVALLDYPSHPNVGDQAIWYGEMMYLRKYNHSVVFTCTACLNADRRSYCMNDYVHDCNFEALEREIGDGVILMHGGGNARTIGEKPDFYMEFRRRVFERFPNNTIISLPQTYWENSFSVSYVQKLRESMSSRVVLLARDSVSMKFIQKNFPSVKSAMCIDSAINIGFIQQNPTESRVCIDQVPRLTNSGFRARDIALGL